MSTPVDALPFVARQFESPAIKSWKERDSGPLRQALIGALDALADSRGLVLDLLVDIEAVALEPRVEAANVLHWRSRPSMDFGARARRLLGFYSGESTLAAAVLVARGADADALMPGNVLWDCEFSIYPLPARPLLELPDPHFDLRGFAGHVEWSLHQDSSDSWMVTARSSEALDRVCDAFSQRFSQAALQLSVTDAPSFNAEK